MASTSAGASLPPYLNSSHSSQLGQFEQVPRGSKEVPKRFQRGPSFNDFEFATCLSVLSMLPGFELDQAPSSRDAEKALDMRWPRPVGAK